MKIDFPRIIQELAVNLQQPLMDPVEDACRISWDNVDMHIYHHTEDNEDLVIVTLDIGETPVGSESTVYSLMLQANFLWIATDYATLSVNPETKMIVLCDKVDSSVVTVEYLTERVSQLYQTALYWQEVIAHESQGSSSMPQGPTSMQNDFAIKI